jgi:SAM-dependent methyltransferase
MHREASDYVFEQFHVWRGDRKGLTILEIGSLNINGSVRDMLRPYSVEYVGIDPHDGPNVDVVANGQDYCHADFFDVVVACEVFEHTSDWKAIVQNAMKNLKDGGIFITTMAGEGRKPHSAIDENPIREWEHYSNIGEWELGQTMKGFFSQSQTNVLGHDLRAWGIK